LTRTILYFPTIAVPSGSWLRRSLLYWDEVASIVPQEVTFRGDTGEAFIPYTPEVRYLLSEGVFKPVPPEHLLIDREGNESNWPAAHEFRQEFESAVTSSGFQQRLPPQGRRELRTRVHRGKLEHYAVEFLLNKRLVKYEHEHEPFSSEWFLFEENTALLYMSLLAKYLADIREDITVPGTDRNEYLDLSYALRAPDEPSKMCLSVEMSNCLPVPRDDVPLEKILDFKDRRRAELLRFRQVIDDGQEELSNAESKQDVKEAISKFHERTERELTDLTTQMRDARLATTAGSLKSLVDAKLPAIMVAGLAAAGFAVIPLDLVVTGGLVSGGVAVGSYLISQRNEQRSNLRGSSYAYLYYSEEDSIIHHLH
jgi:hypothetical protein